MGKLVNSEVASQFPPLQTQEVEVVTVVLDSESDGLHLFKFEVATLKRQSSQRRRWKIRKQRRYTCRFLEALGDKLQLEMVLIPSGSFVMGSPEDEPERNSNEGPQHEVDVSSFFMGRYLVTQAQWRFVAELEQIERALDPSPSRFKDDDRPVEPVSWNDAIEFCNRLSAYTGREYRLPTEAEWEYACRAGTITPFHFGETITTDLANYRGDDIYNDGPKGAYRQETTPVDHFGIANAFGLCDMHGNVWEWCQDHWHDNYEGAPIDGSAWLTEDERANRVRRGGSWFIYLWGCRSAYRNYNSPAYNSFSFGFRVVHCAL
jgi:formylglycine-generating enzyme required for sulfatase activity